MIRIRDELCKNGEILMSPALSYSSKHLHSDVDKEKKEKLPKELEEDKIKREEEKQGNHADMPLVSLLHILWHRVPESTVDIQKLRRERTQPGGRGSPTLSARTARTAALKTACTTWETTSTWSPQSRTSSLTSSTLNVCGRTTPVSLPFCCSQTGTSVSGGTQSV